MISGLEELVDLFDGFVLDQFGVLHDGTKLLPGVKEAVAELHRRGKHLVLLSNSTKTAEASLAHLPSMGLDPSHFLGARLQPYSNFDDIYVMLINTYFLCIKLN